MRTIFWGMLASLLVISSPLLALVGQGQAESGRVALVISPPWGTPIDDILRASKIIEIYPRRAPLGAFVMIEKSDNLETLYDNGAWFILNGEKVLELC